MLSEIGNPERGIDKFIFKFQACQLHLTLTSFVNFIIFLLFLIVLNKS